VVVLVGCPGADLACGDLGDEGLLVDVGDLGASLGVDEKISAAYSAAKAGINALTRALAVQYSPRNIRVNAVAPGFTLSTKNLAAPADVMRQLAGRAALGRAGRSEEQAYVAAFLASDLASFVTGVVVPVDGGWSVKLA
jgi:NAD(P)-dependent dehydrogenase (short-subunit alcohol dehydrogenase family)